MLESGTVGCSAKYSLPHSPFSSPLTVMKTRERLGRGGSWEKASAASTTAVVPDASSSAPLQMASAPTARSEEHTSEPHTQSNLVCRLLLEKKKIHTLATQRL